MRAFTVFAIVLAAVAVASGELHPLGYVEEDLGVIAPEREVLSVEPAPGAPSFRDLGYVDLTDELPPVGNQGGIGSCASWGIAYYHRTQLEYRERQWDLTDPAHQFSPKFCYNQVNGGGDNGSGFENNMGLIVESGCASMADWPYDNSYTEWPSESAYSRAIPYRVQDWAWFRTRDTAGVNNARQMLANGITLPIAIHVWGNFDNISQYDTMYCASQRSGENRGGHIVTLCGYDDTLTTADGTGAFRVVNSWGPGWGSGGFFWMSYEAVMDTFLCQRSVGYMVDTVGYEPRLLGRVKLDHPTRDRVSIDFIVGRRNNPLWYKAFRTWRRARTNQPFPDNNMVFDLTDAADHIENLTTDSIYFATVDGRRDGLSGTIEHVSGQYLPWGNDFASGATPVNIPDNGGTVHAGTRLEQFDTDACANAVYGLSGIVTPDSQYVPEARVWNYGSSPATFPAIMSIGNWADTVTVSGLQPFDSARVVFDAWTSPTRGGVAVRCSTALPGDEYAANNYATDSVHSRLNDIELLEIIVPGDTVDSGSVVRPKVKARNNGTQSETFFAWFRIPGENYLRRVSEMLEPGEAGELAFATWIPKNRGWHDFESFVELDGDMEPGNDSILGQVYVGPPTGIEEEPGNAPGMKSPASVVRGVLMMPGPGTRSESPGRNSVMSLPVLLNAVGRKVMDLAPGANDVRHLSPGVYFVRTGDTENLRRVVLAR